MKNKANQENLLLLILTVLFFYLLREYLNLQPAAISEDEFNERVNKR